MDQVVVGDTSQQQEGEHSLEGQVDRHSRQDRVGTGEGSQLRHDYVGPNPDIQDEQQGGNCCSDNFCSGYTVLYIEEE